MFMFSSCLDEFQKLNTNNEEFGTAEPAAAFHGATKNYNNNSRAHLTGMYSGSMRLMQYLVKDAKMVLALCSGRKLLSKNQ